MKLFVVLAGLALSGAQTLHIQHEEQHEGFVDSWNSFWGGVFGKN